MMLYILIVVYVRLLKMIVKFQLYLLLLILLNTNFGFTQSTDQGGRQCIDINQCDEIQWLQAHQQQNLLDMDELTCGFGQGVPKVWCNLNTITDSSLFGGGMLDTNSNIARCRGYLRVHYISEENILGVINLKRRIRRIGRKKFYRLSVQGTCCWKTYSKSHFRGQQQLLERGFDNSPNFQISSAKIVDC